MVHIIFKHWDGIKDNPGRGFSFVPQEKICEETRLFRARKKQCFRFYAADRKWQPDYCQYKLLHFKRGLKLALMM